MLSYRKNEVDLGTSDGLSEKYTIQSNRLLPFINVSTGDLHIHICLNTCMVYLWKGAEESGGLGRTEELGNQG